MAKSNNNTLLLLGLGAGALFLFKDDLKNVFGGAAKATSGIGDAIQGTGSGIANAASGLGTGINQIGTSAGLFTQDIQRTLDQGTDVIGTLFGQAQRIVQATGDTAIQAGSAVKKGVSNLISKTTSSGSRSSSGSSTPIVQKSSFTRTKDSIPRITAASSSGTSVSSAKLVTNNTLVDEKISSMVTTTKPKSSTLSKVIKTAASIVAPIPTAAFNLFRK